MSEKQWKVGVRRKRYKHHNSKQGSEFPRHQVNQFEGTRLGMHKHYPIKGDVVRAYGCGLRMPYYEYVQRKFVNRPVREMEDYWTKKTMQLKKEGKQIEDDLLWYNVYRSDKDYSRRIHKYYVDEEGIFRKNPDYHRKASIRLSKKQLLENSKKTFTLGRCRKAEPDYKGEYPLLPRAKSPRHVFDAWVIIDDRVCYLPIYIHERADEVLKWKGSYYWNSNARASRPGTEEYKTYNYIQSHWRRVSVFNVPTEHIHYEMVDNPKVARLENLINKHSEIEGREEMVEGFREELKETPAQIKVNLGLGQIHYFVRTVDVEGYKGA